MDTENLAVEEKLKIAEEALAAQKAENERLAVQAQLVVDMKKQELAKVLEAAPEVVKASFVGKELDPMKDLDSVKSQVATYQALEKAATEKALASVNAYREGIAKKFGVAFPEPEKFILSEKPPMEEPKAAQKTETATQTATFEPANRLVDLAAKEQLTSSELLTVTGRFSAMADWYAARRSAALKAK